MKSKFMNHQLLALFIGMALTFTGCGQQPAGVTLQERLLPHPNPTNYEFEASISEVKAAIKKACGDKWRLAEAKKNRGRVWKGDGDADAKRLLTMLLQLGPGSLFFKGDADALAKGILTRPGNENDAYFYGTDSPVGESQVYFKDGQPLIYFADFHIHLTAVDPRRTRVEIFTYDSSVNSGLYAPWSPAQGRSFIYVKVDPTTVEQYQILLRIGEQLGTKDMLQLVTPGSDSPVKELTLPRER
jgi:hypothetical protein